MKTPLVGNCMAEQNRTRKRKAFKRARRGTKRGKKRTWQINSLISTFPGNYFSTQCPTLLLRRLLFVQSFLVKRGPTASCNICIYSPSFSDSHSCFPPPHFPWGYIPPRKHRHTISTGSVSGGNGA